MENCPSYSLRTTAEASGNGILALFSFRLPLHRHLRPFVSCVKGAQLPCRYLFRGLHQLWKLSFIWNIFPIKSGRRQLADIREGKAVSYTLFPARTLNPGVAGFLRLASPFIRWPPACSFICVLDACSVILQTSTTPTWTWHYPRFWRQSGKPR